MASDPYMHMAGGVKTASGVPFGTHMDYGGQHSIGYIRDTLVTTDFILANIVSWMCVAEIAELQRRANLLLPGQHESSVLKSIL